MSAAIRVLLLALAIAAVGAAVLVLRWPDPAAAEQLAVPPDPGPVSVTRVAAESLGVFVQRDPMRLARAPSPTAYDPVAKPEAVAEAPPPPKPSLQLSGILWGSEPSAVLEGVPGMEGARLIRAGDTLGGLRIRRITPTRVEVLGYDTAWTLAVRQPW